MRHSRIIFSLIASTLVTNAAAQENLGGSNGCMLGMSIV